MGNLKKKATIPLSLFYLKYFAYIFVLVLILAVTLLLVFNSLMVGNVIYPANQAERQAASAYKAIQEANVVTEALIPELCEYVVFNPDGNVKAGNLSESEAKQAWKAVGENRTDIGGYYYSVIPRDTEYCVLRYTFSPQYKSPVLRKNLMEPQTLLFVTAISCTLIGILVIAIRFGQALNKRLSSLVVAVNKVEQQELDFDISSSGIKEIDTILHSMDHMRTALKEALEQQWRTEQEKIAKCLHWRTISKHRLRLSAETQSFL